MRTTWSDSVNSSVERITHPITFSHAAFVSSFWIINSSHPIRRLGYSSHTSFIDYLCYIDDSWTGLDSEYLKENYDESTTENIGQYMVIGY